MLITEREPFESPGKHPHEVAVALYSVLVGIVGFMLPTGISRSLETILPGGGQYLFFGLLVAGGAITLFGIFNRRIEGALTERIGLLVLTWLFAAYAIAVIFVGGQYGFVAAMFPVSYAVANVVRAYQISKVIKHWRTNG